MVGNGQLTTQFNVKNDLLKGDSLISFEPGIFFTVPVKYFHIVIVCLMYIHKRRRITICQPSHD